MPINAICESYRRFRRKSLLLIQLNIHALLWFLSGLMEQLIWTECMGKTSCQMSHPLYYMKTYIILQLFNLLNCSTLYAIKQAQQKGKYKKIILYIISRNVNSNNQMFQYGFEKSKRELFSWCFTFPFYCPIKSPGNYHPAASSYPSCQSYQLEEWG